MHLCQKLVNLMDDKIYNSVFQFKRESFSYSTDTMKELSNIMAGRCPRTRLCHECLMPFNTHRNKDNCPVKKLAHNQNSNCCKKCLLPDCSGAFKCGYKYVLMIIAIVCSASHVNKIVELKWNQFCQDNKELLTSFPKGENINSVAQMTSIYERLYNDKDFRECFWNAVNETGIFEAKFFLNKSNETLSSNLHWMYENLNNPLESV